MIDAARYQEHLKSAKWRSIRDAARKRDKYRCVLCNSTRGLQGHHRTYANKYHERVEDVYTLCDRCHELVSHKNHLLVRLALLVGRLLP